MQSYLIDRLGHRGDGVIDTSDGPIFAPYVLPGETITGTLEGDRLIGVRVQEPSADRIKAPCSHFKTCGGCVMQHASEGLQRAWRVRQIEEPLRQVGIEAEVSKVHMVSAASRRRAGFKGRRSKSSGQVCFSRVASHDLIDVTGCSILSPALSDALPILREIVAVAATRKSTVSLQVTEVESGLDVAVDDAKELSPAEVQQLASLSGVMRLTWNGETLFQKERPVLRLGDDLVPLPPGAFLQASREGEAAMIDFVKTAVAGAGYVADLFAGCGTFALNLARDAQVDAFESDRDAVSALVSGWSNGRGMKAVVAKQHDLFRSPLSAGDLKRYDAVVLDPPRAGAAAQISEIAKSKLERVVYISCNPASYARDAALLVGAGFHLSSLEAVDQFRWSRHVELQSVFTR